MASLEQTISRNLECPICLELLSLPKKLSCSHTFCKRCISNMQSCSWQTESVNSLTCPICRCVTDLQHGDLINLNTNVPLKSVVEDNQQLCEMCQTGSKAVHFCQECEKNMCNECLENHNKWPANLKHTVVFVKDIQERKVVLRRKVVYCQEHDQSDGQQNICSDVCLTCKKFICMRCRMLFHDGHTVEDAGKYNRSIQKEIQILQEGGEAKAATIKTHLAVIESQMKRVTDHNDSRNVEITNVYLVSVKLLNDSKLALVQQVNAHDEPLYLRLQKMKGDHERLVASLKSASVLLGRSLEAPLSGDVIAIRDSLSGELQSLIDRDDPDNQLVTDVGDRAEELLFTPRFTPDQQDPLSIGKFCVKDLRVRSVKLSGRMSSLASSVDGRLAVGYCGGGIEFVSENGQFEETVLNDVKIRGARFLPDGGYVVLDVSNTITTYSSECVKSEAYFATLGSDEGGVGSLAVGSFDQIYVGYCRAMKIQVFHSRGGTAFREIPCNGVEPEQIAFLDDYLIISYRTSTRIIAFEGVAKQKLLHKVKRLNAYPYGAVTQDKFILIAWVNHDQGLVTIEKFTNKLKLVETLLKDYKIEKPKNHWYSLQVFTSGGVAFCSPNRLYILACPT
ncbi:uncharacterized protein LOC115926532 [Strongylocentrotus purpuratus]|uniref:Uncharacterized protein n=1 Tax=Strongylocentrotus purpuratus TaxID=7668 RepID=A0A7M7P8X4_STRPU|nr:uncharacterized protein LOC115926532 [Strongylocentrotus purpuratus]